MPAQTRVGDKNTGHDYCPPVPLITGSPDVFVNLRRAGRVTDRYAIHSCPIHFPHQGIIGEGSPNVFVNLLPTGRIGDLVICPAPCFVAEGSPNVFINDKGNTWSMDSLPDAANSSDSTGDSSVSADEKQRRADLNYEITKQIVQSRIDDKRNNLSLSLPAKILADLANASAVYNSYNVGKQYQTQFDVENEYLDTDELILYQPQIATAMANRIDNEQEKKGWLLLAVQAKKWLAGTRNKASIKDDPFIIDID